jgi:hypothetical protein
VEVLKYKKATFNWTTYRLKLIVAMLKNKIKRSYGDLLSGRLELMMYESYEYTDSHFFPN